MLWFQGAVSGMIVSHAFTIWVVFGSTTIDKPRAPYLPLSVDGCNNQSFSLHKFPHDNLTPVQLSNRVSYGEDDSVAETSLSGSPGRYDSTCLFTRVSQLGCGTKVNVSTTKYLKTKNKEI